MVEEQILNLEQAKKMLGQENPHAGDFRYILEHLNPEIKEEQEAINEACEGLLNNEDFKVSDAAWIRAVSNDQVQRERANEKAIELIKKSDSISA